MATWIQRIETQVPEQSYTQEYASSIMQNWAKDEKQKRIIRAIYKKSGIEKRHSVIPSFDGKSEDSFFKNDADGCLIPTSTAERNEMFSTESKKISVELAKKTIDNTSAHTRSDITHVITASCTGFYNPGPDYYIVTELGLPDSVQRYNLGFMGCYAAFPALRMAKQFCEADPNAVVLVMCLELCSLHLQINDNVDSVLSNSLFSDGAAAAIVSSREPAADSSALELCNFASSLATDGEADMAWTLGNQGFDITLSSYVPKIIGANINGIVDSILTESGRTTSDINTWAIHPGGKTIVDKIQNSLGLEDSQIEPSRNVLRQYGNMSSVTILFVFKEIMDRKSDCDKEQICAMAFGPGLTIETAILAGQKATDKNLNKVETADEIPAAATA